MEPMQLFGIAFLLVGVVLFIAWTWNETEDGPSDEDEARSENVRGEARRGEDATEEAMIAHDDTFNIPQPSAATLKLARDRETTMSPIKRWWIGKRLPIEQERDRIIMEGQRDFLRTVEQGYDAMADALKAKARVADVETEIETEHFRRRAERHEAEADLEEARVRKAKATRKRKRIEGQSDDDTDYHEPL